MVEFNIFPISYQTRLHDCALACLRMIAHYFGKELSDEQYCLGENGISVSEITLISKSIGLNSVPFRVDMDELKTDIPFPIIVFWGNNHFVVAYEVDDAYVSVCDPAMGRIRYTHEEFKNGWYGDNERGVIIVFEPL